MGAIMEKQSICEKKNVARRIERKWVRGGEAIRDVIDRDGAEWGEIGRGGTGREEPSKKFAHAAGGMS